MEQWSKLQSDRSKKDNLNCGWNFAIRTTVWRSTVAFIWPSTRMMTRALTIYSASVQWVSFKFYSSKRFHTSILFVFKFPKANLIQLNFATEFTIDQWSIKWWVGAVGILLCFGKFPWFPDSVDVKVEKIYEDSLDSIPLPSPSVEIQIIGGKVYLR